MNFKDFTSTFLTDIHPGIGILDIGGGEGIFAQKFVERGAHVTGMALIEKNPADTQVRGNCRLGLRIAALA